MNSITRSEELAAEIAACEPQVGMLLLFPVAESVTYQYRIMKYWGGWHVEVTQIDRRRRKPAHRFPEHIKLSAFEMARLVVWTGKQGTLFHGAPDVLATG